MVGEYICHLSCSIARSMLSFFNLFLSSTSLVHRPTHFQESRVSVVFLWVWVGVSLGCGSMFVVEFVICWSKGLLLGCCVWCLVVRR